MAAGAGRMEVPVAADQVAASDECTTAGGCMMADGCEAAAADSATASRKACPIKTSSPRPKTASRCRSSRAAACSNCTPTATASSAIPTTIYTRERTDPFVPGTMIDKFRLREGVLINGMVQQGRRQQGPRLKEILDVDGMKPEDYPNVKTFDALTPINPESWLRLETGPAAADHPRHGPAHAAGQGPAGADRRSAADRQDDPVAAHQPRDRRRTIPDVKLIMLLIDERPEEVTDMQRCVNGDVIASSLDRDVESHVRLSQLVVERCQPPGRDGQGRVPADGLDHPHGAGLQQVGRQHRPHDERRRRHQGAGHPQEAVRHGPRVRGRRLADDRRPPP